MHAAIEACCVTGANLGQPLALAMLNVEAVRRAGDPAGRSALEASLAGHLKAVNAALDPHEQLDCLVVTTQAWTVDNDLIRTLVERAGGKEGGIVSPKGPAGSMLMFHSCLLHASSSNLSPWNRVSVYLSLCAVSNHIRRHKRPEYIAHRDFTPIECLSDDCLLTDVPVELPWKNGMPGSALVTSPEPIDTPRKAA